MKRFKVKLGVSVISRIRYVSEISVSIGIFLPHWRYLTALSKYKQNWVLRGIYNQTSELSTSIILIGCKFYIHNIINVNCCCF